MEKQVKFYSNLVTLISHGMHAEIIKDGSVVINELIILIHNSTPQVASVLRTEVKYIKAIVSHARNQLQK